MIYDNTTYVKIGNRSVRFFELTNT